MNRAFTRYIAIAPKLCGFSLALCLAAAVSAESFYKWKDSEGVTHYGASPPQGVNAIKINTHTGSSGVDYDSKGGNSEEQSGDEEEVELDPKMLAKMNENCQRERQRLSTLQSGNAIRMTKADGSEGYLTRQEISREIANSKSAIKTLCRS